MPFLTRPPWFLELADAGPLTLQQRGAWSRETLTEAASAPSPLLSGKEGFLSDARTLRRGQARHREGQRRTLVQHPWTPLSALHTV